MKSSSARWALSSPFQDVPYLMGRPWSIVWEGWETDTLKLQRAGWSLSAVQDIQRDAIRLAIRNSSGTMRGVTHLHEHRFMQFDRDYPVRTPLGMMAMGGHVVCHVSGPLEFAPITGEPKFLRDGRRDLDDFAAFAPAPLVMARVIALPEPTVDQLLATILAAQEADKTAYFTDLVAREKVLPEHRVHANIISLRQAA